jgi:hypothetical protein
MKRKKKKSLLGINACDTDGSPCEKGIPFEVLLTPYPGDGRA